MDGVDGEGKESGGAWLWWGLEGTVVGGQRARRGHGSTALVMQRWCGFAGEKKVRSKDGGERVEEKGVRRDKVVPRFSPLVFFCHKMDACRAEKAEDASLESSG